MYKHRISVSIIIIMLLSVLVIATTRPAKAGTFTLAVESWTYPDEYGQGIQRIDLVFTNGTTYQTCGWFYPYEEFTDFDSNEWFLNTSLVISVGTWLNSTLVGFSSLEEGLNYVRHSIIVSLFGETVFSQQNFTYNTGLDENAPLYYYVHNTTLGCFNTEGVTYELVVDCEIYY